MSGTENMRDFLSVCLGMVFVIAVSSLAHESSPVWQQYAGISILSSACLLGVWVCRYTLSWGVRTLIFVTVVLSTLLVVVKGR